MIGEFQVSSHEKEQIIDITAQVKNVLNDSKVKRGLCTVYVPHATAAITINENADPNITLDILDALNKVIAKGVWRHDKIDNNAHAHIKAAIIGPSESVPVKNKELTLGSWQDIFLCDFDGPRTRTVIVTILGDA